MRILYPILVSFLFVSFVKADEVIVGWHSFETMGQPLATEAPDEIAPGYRATMGNVVIDQIVGGAGGGQKVVKFNTKESPNYYGSLYAVNTPVELDSGVLLCANGANKSIGRLDFMLTNMTGRIVELKSIHFDCKLIYGTYGESWVQVSHLSGVSDLEDLPWAGLCVTDKLRPSERIWYDADVALAKMGDLLLEPGQTVAFRIEVGIDGTTPAGLSVDNIAIVATEAP